MLEYNLKQFCIICVDCAGCHEDLKEGQALIALDRQWHVWCFKCHTCSAVLHGEYMGKLVSTLITFY